MTEPKQLYMVKDFGEDEESLSLEDGYETSRVANRDEITLKGMADLLDQDAEDQNAHEFVATHRGLAVILVQEAGMDKAWAVMRRLVNFRGLHGMVGIYSTDVAEAERELGITLDDEDWDVPGEVKHD